MDEALTSLEKDIKNERRDLDRNLEELEHQARALADWRTHYRNHPGMALAIAASAGLTLAAVVPSSHRPRRARPFNATQPSQSSMPSAALARLDPHGHARQRWADTWDQIVDSLAGVGAAVLIGVVSKYVPGFNEEYESRRQSGFMGDRPWRSGT